MEAHSRMTEKEEIQIGELQVLAESVIYVRAEEEIILNLLSGC